MDGTTNGSTVSVAQVVVDCGDAARLAGFWSAVLGRPVDDGASPYFATIRDAVPALMFLQVPEAKELKNRLHLDLTAPDWRAEAQRLVSLGATVVGEYAEYGTEWISLTDPEGNEFDIGAPRSS